MLVRSAVPAADAILRFTTYGVGIDIELDDGSLARELEPLLPPRRRDRGGDPPDVRYALRRAGPGRFALVEDDRALGPARGPARAVEALDAALRTAVALRAPERIFVHAGAVAAGGRALVLPGRSSAGKSTLVAALVRRGAVYLSDEYAVLDAAGRVHPYPRAIALRSPGGRVTRIRPDALGGTTATEAHPVGLVAVTRHRPGARWRPRAQTRGTTALALLDNVVAARTRPEEALRCVTAALTDAAGVESDRGEADEAAAALLAALARESA